MPLYEAVRLALATIRVQKLKSFFTLLGVCIGVMFLITVVSIVANSRSLSNNPAPVKAMNRLDYQAVV